jgi:methylthioribose-1-phosphate isomerase
MRVFEFLGDRIVLLDQTLLPGKKEYIEIKDVDGLVEAIKSMRVRGAPLLGIISAYGVVLEAKRSTGFGGEKGREILEGAIQKLAETRPTAYNLFNSLTRMKRVLDRANPDRIFEDLFEEAKRIEEEEIERCENISLYGVEILPENSKVLTICNTGTLATGGIGTALGVIKMGWERGRIREIYVCETRPLLQGSRLTMWELQEEGIPATLIPDSSASFLMKRGEINVVIVGADRIARNGDTANKIGTLSLAISAKTFDIPFYVAAPLSTFDPGIKSGDEIKIEEREPEEVLKIGDVAIAPEGTRALNLAFDVTPGEYIKGFITEKGIFVPPFGERIFE